MVVWPSFKKKLVIVSSSHRHHLLIKICSKIYFLFNEIKWKSCRRWKPKKVYWKCSGLLESVWRKRDPAFLQGLPWPQSVIAGEIVWFEEAQQPNVAKYFMSIGFGLWCLMVLLLLNETFNSLCGCFKKCRSQPNYDVIETFNLNSAEAAMVQLTIGEIVKMW